MIDEQPRQIEQPRHPGDDGDDVEGFDVEEEHHLTGAPRATVQAWTAGTSPVMIKTISASAKFGLALFHELDKPGHMLGRSLRHDAMAEIEHEGLVA
jgi:hypothetical protein